MDFDIGQVIGAGISAVGQHSANRSNRAMARENMAWMEGMSNTSYQRSISDMKAAGLNPLYWLKGGGASTPQGQMSDSKNPFEGAKSFTALGNERLRAEIDSLKANAGKATKEGDTAEALAEYYKAQTGAATSAKSLSDLNSEKLRTEMAKYKNAQQFYESKAGKYMQMLGLTFDQISNLWSGVVAGKQAFTPAKVKFGNEGPWTTPGVG